MPSGSTWAHLFKSENNFWLNYDWHFLENWFYLSCLHVLTMGINWEDIVLFLLEYTGIYSGNISGSCSELWHWFSLESLQILALIFLSVGEVSWDLPCRDKNILIFQWLLNNPLF